MLVVDVEAEVIFVCIIHCIGESAAHKNDVCAPYPLLGRPSSAPAHAFSCESHKCCFTTEYLNPGLAGSCCLRTHSTAESYPPVHQSCLLSSSRRRSLTCESRTELPASSKIPSKAQQVRMASSRPTSVQLSILHRPRVTRKALHVLCLGLLLSLLPPHPAGMASPLPFSSICFFKSQRHMKQLPADTRVCFKAALLRY